MQSGVILSTGNVLNAPGPNTSMLNDGSTTWPGDLDLEATLAQSGISMVSSNSEETKSEFSEGLLEQAAMINAKAKNSFIFYWLKFKQNLSKKNLKKSCLIYCEGKLVLDWKGKGK